MGHLMVMGTWNCCGAPYGAGDTESQGCCGIPWGAGDLGVLWETSWCWKPTEVGCYVARHGNGDMGVLRGTS